MATRFLYQDQWRLGGITASTSDLAFDPNSTRNPLRGLPWRSQSTTFDHWLSVWWGGSTVTATAVAIVSPLLVGTVGTVTLQTSADGVTWADVATIPQTTNLTNLWYAFFPSTTAAYWRIRVARASGTGYFQVGTVLLGTYYEATYGIQVDTFQPTREDLSVITQGRSGTISRSVYSQRERFSLHFQQMPAADGIAFTTMFNTVGKGGRLLVTIDETNPERTWYGYFEDNLVRQNVILEEYDIDLKFVEDL